MGAQTDKIDRETELTSKKNLGTRRRGLSQRLQSPLSLESNIVEERLGSGKPLVVQDEQEDKSPDISEVPATRAMIPAQAPQTRQVVPKEKPPARKEGLLTEGTQLQNRYKILGIVGVGGMGAVYKAQDLRFASVVRLCAVKEMINTATNPQVREMIVRNFEREASILATLNHPAIPQVYDYFTEGSRSYLVIEFIQGQDLEEYLGGIDGFFSESQVVDWALQLCDVLSFLHNHKPRPIIFRDMKPSNVMLNNQSRIRLVDFGIAKIFQSGEKGTMIGTEGYSPPEQYRGVAEPRGDVYALGATLHHLLSKQDPRLEPPFSFHERPIHKTNPTVSRELVDIIDKALEYDLNKRWGSAEEFKRALLSLSSARNISAGTASLIGEKTTAFSGPGVVKPLWRFTSEDEVRGSVTVVDGIVYVPSYDNNVYALLAEDGEFLWKYPTEGGVASSPWVSEGMVIFGSIDKAIYSVDAQTGNLLWSTPTKGRVFSSAYGEFSHVFIGSDDRNLYAIHQPSGRVAWTYTADGEIRSRPLVKENMIIFSCQMGMVYALGLNRELRWRFRARRGILSSPTLSHGLVFVGSLDWNVYALDIRSGWTAWRYRTSGAIVSTIAIDDGLVFFGSTDGYFYALDAEDGRLVWRYQIEAQISASPKIHNGQVYFGGVDGILYCLDARSGTLNWSYETSGPITGAPSIVDDVIYFGSSDHYVYAIPA